jgi:predicted RNA-binding Zn-ribbon protein involved in translation (DUF1610 family)
VWGLFKENVPLQRLISSGYVLCWAAKWYGEGEIFFDSVYHSKPKKMLKRIHDLLEEADAVVHYNGSNFDIPTLNKEFLLHHMTPPAPYKQIDLLKTARGQFRFTSNKLDYVAGVLGLGNKLKHAGFELWIKCMNNDPEAWAEMQAYNINDVILLEQVYDSFKPWIRNHPNVALYTEGAGSPVCPHCGGAHLVKRGFATTAVSKYQRFRCSDCGTWSRSRVNVAERPELTAV